MENQFSDSCYFCDRAMYIQSMLYEDDFLIILKDNFPISEKHILVIPKIHVANIFELEIELYERIFAKIKEYSHILKSSDSTIEGFNLGVNQGKVAGQTVMHVHVHLIPRRNSDSKDPRGGVRWIFPDKAKYWDD